jgi:hypothetical protein
LEGWAGRFLTDLDPPFHYSNIPLESNKGAVNLVTTRRD